MRWVLVLIFLLEGSRALAVDAKTKLEFSQQVISFDRFFYVMWSPLWIQLQDTYFKKYSVQSKSNGDYEFWDFSTQQLVRKVQVRSDLKGDRSRRYLSFTYLPGPNSGENSGIIIEVTSEGKDLNPISLENVRIGKLPFYPEEDGVVWHEVKLSDFDPTKTSTSNGMRFIFTKRVDTGSLMLTADCYRPDGSRYLSYVESASPDKRSFTYTLGPAQTPTRAMTMGVEKTKSAQMLLGSEVFQVNASLVSPKSYYSMFNMAVLPIALYFIGTL